VKNRPPNNRTMAPGSFALGHFPLEMVEFACERCERRGRLLKTKLIEVHGPDISLPDLRTAIARCDRAKNTSDPCGAHFVVLVPQRG